MLNRPMSRLATAVAAAGTVCALGAATAAAAAPSAPRSWSGPKGPVPHAFSTATPGLTRIFLTGTGKNGTLAAWKGKFDDRIHYELRIGGHWSAARTVPGAATSAGPSVGFYPDPTGHDAVLAVWRKLASSKIRTRRARRTPTARSRGRRLATLPGSLTSTTTAPAVLFPANAPHDRVIVAWKGPYDHVRYSVGDPGRASASPGRRRRGCPPRLITKTGAAPGLAEVQTGTGQGHAVRVLEGLPLRPGALRHDFRPAEPEPQPPHLERGQGRAARRDRSPGPRPAPSAAHGAGPLLLVYKAPRRSECGTRRCTPGWSAPRTVRGASTAVGPALLGGLLATTASDTSGSIFYRYSAAAGSH